MRTVGPLLSRQPAPAGRGPQRIDQPPQRRPAPSTRVHSTRRRSARPRPGTARAAGVEAPPGPGAQRAARGCGRRPGPERPGEVPLLGPVHRSPGCAGSSCRAAASSDRASAGGMSATNRTVPSSPAARMPASCGPRGEHPASTSWSTGPPDRGAPLAGRGPPSAASSVAAGHLAHRLAEADRLHRREVLRAHRDLLGGPGGQRRGPAAAGRRAHEPRSMRSSWGTTQPASPISSARGASMRSPVSSSSIACCQLIRCGRRMAPTIVGTPRRTSGKPNSARSLAMTKSHQETQREAVAEAVAVDRGDHRLEDLPAALEGVDRRLLPERAREVADRGAVSAAACRRPRRTPSLRP